MNSSLLNNKELLLDLWMVVQDEWTAFSLKATTVTEEDKNKLGGPHCTLFFQQLVIEELNCGKAPILGFLMAYGMWPVA